MKKTGLVGMIGNLLGYKEDSIESQSVRHHCVVLKYGLSFRNAVSKLCSLGAVDERVRRDKSKARMVEVLQTHSQVCEQVRKFEKLREDTLKTVHDNGLDDTTLDLMALDPVGAFQGLLEDDRIYDTMARHLVIHGESVNQTCEKIEKGVKGIMGANSWKKTLLSADAIEKVLEVAGDTLVKAELKGVNFLNLIEGLQTETRLY